MKAMTGLCLLSTKFNLEFVNQKLLQYKDGGADSLIKTSVGIFLSHEI
jgi:hypothetical protein